jgi:hypothetical protein
MSNIARHVGLVGRTLRGRADAILRPGFGNRTRKSQRRAKAEKGKGRKRQRQKKASSAYQTHCDFCEPCALYDQGGLVEPCHEGKLLLEAHFGRSLDEQERIVNAVDWNGIMPPTAEEVEAAYSENERRSCYDGKGHCRCYEIGGSCCGCAHTKPVFAELKSPVFLCVICGKPISEGSMVWLNDHPAHSPKCPDGRQRTANLPVREVPVYESGEQQTHGIENPPSVNPATLEEVMEDASARVAKWPEWRKSPELRESEGREQQTLPSQEPIDPEVRIADYACGGFIPNDRGITYVGGKDSQSERLCDIPGAAAKTYALVESAAAKKWRQLRHLWPSRKDPKKKVE